jgi:hypothetical protein
MARRTKKSAKKHSRKLSTWQKFQKAHAGKGMSVKEMSRLFHSKGLGKKKAPKKGKKKAKRARSVNTSSKRYRDYARKFRENVINELVAEGLSLATARKQASEMLKDAVGEDAVIQGYKAEYQTERSKDAEKRAAERQKQRDAEDAKRDAAAAKRAADRAKAAKKKAEAAAEDAKRRAEENEAFRRDIQRKMKDLQEADLSFSP